MSLGASTVAEVLPPPPRATAARAHDDTGFDEQVDAALRESAGEDRVQPDIDRDGTEPEAQEVAAETPSAPQPLQHRAEVASPIVLQILSPDTISADTSGENSPTSAPTALERTKAGDAAPEPANDLGKATAAPEQAPLPQATPTVNADAKAIALAQADTAASVQAKAAQAVGATVEATATLATAPQARPEPSIAPQKQAKSAPAASEKDDAKKPRFTVEARDVTPATVTARAAQVAKSERAIPATQADAPQQQPLAPTANTLTSSLSPTLAHHVGAQQAVVEQAAARAAPAATQVAREIIRRFDGGNTRFELRLDPPELGRIEVRMDVSRDHRVTAVIAADSPQALTELMRHARDLEQSLQSAGLELAENGLSFDLRQGTQDSENARDARGGSAELRAETTPEAPAPNARPLGYERWRGVRIDMMV